MKKKKLKKKTFIILSIILILVFLLIIYYSREQIKVSLSSNLDVQINTQVYIKDFVSSEYKIINLDEQIDTSSLGEKSISAKVLNKNKKEKLYEFNIKVIDTIEPIIEFNKTIEIKENEKIDLLKDVVVTDNSNEIITATVEGDYDISKAGNYKLYYVAVDSSNNIKKEEFNLKVLDDNITITSKGYKLVNNNGVYSIDGIVIVNKTYSLPSNYGNGLTSVFTSNYNKMKSAAANDGIILNIVSGFRSYSTQVGTYNYWVSRYGKSDADTISARAGHSEHQLGLAVDINSLSQSFKNTAEGKWLNNNAYKYGFILRFPEGKSSETGYNFEPWHYRYVGTTLSEKLYNNGNWITIENYYGITSKYK